MEKAKIEKFKAELERELATLELELTDIGHINSSDHYDWTATAGEYKTGSADKNIVADKIEETQTNEAIIDKLEVRRKNIVEALEAIEKGTYGMCKVCGAEIDSARLEANPAATTCIEHAE